MKTLAISLLLLSLTATQAHANSDLWGWCPISKAKFDAVFEAAGDNLVIIARTTELDGISPAKLGESLYVRELVYSLKTGDYPVLKIVETADNAEMANAEYKCYLAVVWANVIYQQNVFLELFFIMGDLFPEPEE